jgi:hypothetical protein
LAGIRLVDRRRPRGILREGNDGQRQRPDHRGGDQAGTEGKGFHAGTPDWHRLRAFPRRRQESASRREAATGVRPADSRSMVMRLTLPEVMPRVRKFVGAFEGSIPFLTFRG